MIRIHYMELKAQGRRGGGRERVGNPLHGVERLTPSLNLLNLYLGIHYMELKAVLPLAVAVVDSSRYKNPLHGVERLPFTST